MWNSAPVFLSAPYPLQTPHALCNLMHNDEPAHHPVPSLVVHTNLLSATWTSAAALQVFLPAPSAANTTACPCNTPLRDLAIDQTPVFGMSVALCLLSLFCSPSQKHLAADDWAFHPAFFRTTPCKTCSHHVQSLTLFTYRTPPPAPRSLLRSSTTPPWSIFLPSPTVSLRAFPTAPHTRLPHPTPRSEPGDSAIHGCYCSLAVGSSHPHFAFSSIAVQ